MRWGKLCSVALLGLFLTASGLFAQDKKDEAKKDDAKKDVTPLLKLPSSADFKSKISFDDDQCKKVDDVYVSYKEKVDTAQKAKDDGDKKAGKDLKNLKTEIVAKLRDLCKDDDQKTKFDDLVGKKKKKNQN
jgi:hypothetical protein